MWPRPPAFAAFTWTRCESGIIARWREHFLGLDYSIAHETPEFLLLAREKQRGAFALHTLTPGRLYLFGTVFGASRVLPDISSPADMARALTKSVWGRYVAFLRGEEGWRVFRDPSGALECWRAEARGFDVVFSSLEDAKSCLVESGLNQPDWQAIGACVKRGRIGPGRCGLAGVAAVEPGHLQKLGRDDAPEAIWRAEDFASPATRTPDHAIADALRSSVRAWASLHEKIAHQLSGGLDSACVLACLCEGIDPERLEAWSFFPSDVADEDERIYARATAERLGVKLHECEMRAGGVDYESLAGAPLPPRPSLSWLSFADRRLVDWQGARSASALMSGEGGDHLLLRSHGAVFAVDYARRFGLRLGLLACARDGAAIAGLSIWEVLARAIDEGLLRRPVSSTAPMEADAFGLGPAFDVHGPAPSKCKFPGKARQVRALTEARDYLDLSVLNARLDGFPAMLSQPFIEACLTSPTYAFGEGGVDRAPLRAGFASALPEIVVRRRSKAGMTRYTIDALTNNLPWLRARLLDGDVAKTLELDRARLERTLRRETLIGDPPLDQILGLLSAECWLARWRA
jgi:asparagine synthase (glutamine-hydrolysing)